MLSVVRQAAIALCDRIVRARSHGMPEVANAHLERLDRLARRWPSAFSS